jgi:predicted DNA-binding protein
MPADQPRTRTVGCKMTDSEYERLTAVAEQDGQTLGEWVREVLCRIADHPINRIEELLPWSLAANLAGNSSRAA